MKYLGTVAMLLTVIGSGCKKNPTATSCAAIGWRSLSVTAKDSVTGTLMANAVLRAVGTYSDSVAVGSNLNLYPVSLAGAAGTYLVTVQAPGYSAWTHSETVTSSDPICGRPDPLFVTALLQRTP